MRRLRGVVTRRRLATVAAVTVGLGVLFAARLWLDRLTVPYSVAAGLLAAYGLGLLGLFTWRDRIQARQITALDADLDQLWEHVGELRDWLDGDQPEDQVPNLDRPTPAQHGGPGTVIDYRPHPDVPSSAVATGRHRATT